MKTLSKRSRIGALILCLATLLAVAVPAVAANISRYGTVKADNTPIYSDGAMTTKIGEFMKDDIVAIEGAASTNANVYVVRKSSTGTDVGYMQKAAFSKTSTTLAAGKTIADMRSVVTSSAGYITNCKSSVTFRAEASTTSKKIGSLKLNEKITILAEEAGFYKIKNSKGVEGYVAVEYAAFSDGSSSSGGSSATTTGKDTGKITLGKDGAIKVAPNSGTPISTVKSGMSTAASKNSDTRGYIYISGTNISLPILYNKNVNYYDSNNIDKKKSSEGAVHAFYDMLTRNNTITAHNMRGSNQQFHQLSHIYDKAMGKSSCTTTDYKCASASLSKVLDVKDSKNRTWDINWKGYNKWEIFAMYQTPANEPKSTITYNISHLAKAKGAEIQKWVQYQKDRSEVKFNTAVSTEDIFMTVYTCGRNYDNADAQSRIYFFLKAVK